MKYNLSNAHNVVYIAGPITKPCPMDNAYRACQFFRQLLGLGVVIPMMPQWSVTQEMIAPLRDVESWYAYDLKLMKRCCDGLVRLPGASVGADGEVEYAKEVLGIPCWILDGYEITSGGVLVFKGLKDHRFNNFVKEISEWSGNSPLEAWSRIPTTEPTACSTTRPASPPPPPSGA